MDLRFELENNPKGNHISSVDIDENINKVEVARNLQSSSSHTLSGKYKDIVCCALVTYISYLEGVKKDVSTRLSGANPRLSRIDNEISLASVTRNEICGK